MQQTGQNYVTVTTTVSTESAAAELARKLVESRQAACVQYWPIRSTYRWGGKIEEESEFLVVAKTMASLSGALQRLIGELHSYDVPQITVTPILTGSDAYLSWIATETEAGEQQKA